MERRTLDRIRPGRLDDLIIEVLLSQMWKGKSLAVTEARIARALRIKVSWALVLNWPPPIVYCNPMARFAEELGGGAEDLVGPVIAVSELLAAYSPASFF